MYLITIKKKSNEKSKSRKMFTDQQIADWRDNQLHDYLKSLEDDNCVELIKCAAGS